MTNAKILGTILALFEDDINNAEKPLDFLANAYKIYGTFLVKVAEEGYEKGFKEGELIGYERGMDEGYHLGYEDGLDEKTYSI